MLSETITRTAGALDQALNDGTPLTPLTHRNLVDVLYGWRSQVRELEERSERLDAIQSTRPAEVPAYGAGPRLVVDNEVAAP